MDRITIESDKMGGQPCIRGYRFTVAQLVRLIAAGMTTQQIRREFDFIEDEDVTQALLFAAAAVEAQRG